MKKHIDFLLTLNGHPHARGSLEYLAQVIKNYLYYNQMYEKEYVKFEIEKINN